MAKACQESLFRFTNQMGRNVRDGGDNDHMSVKGCPVSKVKFEAQLSWTIAFILPLHLKRFLP